MIAHHHRAPLATLLLLFTACHRGGGVPLPSLGTAASDSAAAIAFYVVPLM